MIRLRSKLGLTLALSALAAAPAAFAEAQDDFAQGIQLLRQGQKEEALAAFQRALGADPTSEEAYEMWLATDQEILLDMLVEGGEFQKIAKRFIDRATLGRRERMNDSDAINGLIGELRAATDVVERQRAVRALASDHGEYAVPRLVQPLADPGNEDWRVVAMTTLTQMGTDVVLPLLASLATEDAYQRANIAMVLGYIGDPRAAAWLSALSQLDGDPKVVRASQAAGQKCGATGDLVAQFLKLGEDYHYRRDNVLRDFDYSDVVWEWDGGTIVSHAVPRAIYNNELSKRAYYAALAIDPTSVDALAGIARASTDIAAKLEALDAKGEDVGEYLDQAREGSLAVATAGVEAIDRALHWSVITDDSATGVRLTRALAVLADAPTAGLMAALDSSDGGMRGEAAVALGDIASSTATAAGPDVVSALGANVGREVVRLAAIIDADTSRASALIAALTAEGVLVNHRGSGAQGIALLHRVPGVDVIIVGDGLPDLTIDAVLSDISRNPVTDETPVLLATGDQDLADAYSARVAGALFGTDDLSALEGVFSASVDGDRARADDLSQRSATALARLAHAGRSDLSGILDELTRPLAHRSDAVTIPAMHALAAAGSPDQLGSLVAVVADGERSDEARIAAAHAMAGIFGRNPVPGDAVVGLAEVLSSDASLAVRAAVARALGRVRLPGDIRAELVRNVRVDVQAGE